MYRVDDENRVLAAVDEVQNGLGGVTAPHLDVGFQREQHVGEETLVDVGPLEFWNAEGGSGGAGTEHGSRRRRTGF